MEVVRLERWRRIGDGLEVPDSILDKIDAECSSNDEKMSALIDYVVTIIPDITWEEIATALYKENEEKAVERVKPYLHILHGGPCFNTAHSLNILLPSPTSIINGCCYNDIYTQVSTAT